MTYVAVCAVKEILESLIDKMGGEKRRTTGSSSNAYFSLSSLHSRSSRAPIVLLALPIQYIRYNLRLGQGDSDC